MDSWQNAKILRIVIDVASANGFWLLATHVDPVERRIRGTRRGYNRGCGGGLSQRLGFPYGDQPRPRGGIAKWVIDGEEHHRKQGGCALTAATVRQRSPDAHAVRAIREAPKLRDALALGPTPAARTARCLPVTSSSTPSLASRPASRRLTGRPRHSLRAWALHISCRDQQRCLRGSS